MTREESLVATWHVLGSNRAERRNNVRTMVSTIFRGGNVLTAVEEPIEGRWKSGLDNGRYTREQGLAWVRLAEKATGQKFLSAADAEVLGSADKAPRSLTEAISAIVTADVLGRRKDGTRLPAGLVTEGLNAAVRQAAGVKERGEVVQFGQFLRAWRALFGQVFSRARALNKARAEGRLGADYEGFLDDLMGTDGRGNGNESAAIDDTSRSESITEEAASRGEIDVATFGMVPKMRQDKPGSWEEVKTGHTWDSAKKFLPKLKDSRPVFAERRGTWETLVRNVAAWLGKAPKVEDPWGAKSP
ncbi:hypothetical protein [Roseimicrobium sp. ORNL1]|uniref:hypothetical protein n=1 Tax=Roseimicrobium sp. ORNL1 TaxID=2711231 RepID=UPI0013E0F665|nr:hypothetical protein [Roseimicrobium sp. ORNL1]QIF01918.1 hypothetical protein G5S37_10385 [Roseimicrobium sp. ORNL1]